MMLSFPVFWIVVGFLAGSVPFSVLVGRAILGKDIRRYGDGNPGASNVVRAGSPFWGVMTIILDYFKGAIPVGLACFWAGISGWSLVIVALAPVLGHAYSPFLRFRGGKAVAVTFGVWSGLTLWVGPTLLGISLGLWFAVLAVEGWAVMASMAALSVYLVASAANPLFGVIWLGNVLVLARKHRADLSQLPRLRPWIRKGIRS